MDKKFRINAIISILFVLFNSILGFLRIPLMVKTFGEYENGFYTKLISLAVTFKIIDLGISAILNSKVSEYYFKKNWEKFNYYFSMSRKIYNRLTIAAFALLFALAFILPIVEKSFLYNHSYFLSVTYIFIIFLPNVLFFYKSHYLTLVFCYKETSRNEISNFLIGISIFLGILISIWTIKNMLVVIIITTTLAILNDGYWKYRYYKKAKKNGLVSNLKVKVEKELLSHSKYSSILVAFSNISTALNLSIIGIVYTNNAVSWYSSISAYTKGISSIFIATLLSTSYNTLLEYNSTRTKQELSKMIKNITILQQYVAVVVISGMFVFFPSLLKIVSFAPKSENIKSYVFISGTEIYLWWAMMRFNNLAYIQRKFKKMILPFTVTTILNIVLSYICTKYIKPYGISIGSITQWILMYLFLNKLVYDKFFNDLFRIIKGYLVIWFIYFAFTHFLDVDLYLNQSNIFYYAIKAVIPTICLVIFTSCIYVLTERTLIFKISSILKKKIKNKER